MWPYKPTVLAIGMALLSGCVSTFAPSERKQSNDIFPEQWQQLKSETAPIKVQDAWVATLNTPQLNNLIEKALNNNQELLQAHYDVAILKQQLIVAGADLWPSLELSSQLGRSKDNRPVSYSSSTSLSLDLSYEVDLWGALSDSKREASLNYLAQQAEYEQQKQQLVADVVIAWFDLITQQQLLELYNQRETNSQQNLEIIESGYKQGLNAALDVYLARNELNSEHSRIATQKANVVDAARTLERLLGEYPKGAISANAELPVIKEALPLGLPSQLITRKAELKASWYSLLASDSLLAYTHKQRFPSINLSASLSDQSNELSDLLSPSSLAWSLIGNISAPLFNAGKLKANEEIANLAVKQQEQLYLQTLYDAFNDVESGITNQVSLTAQYKSTLSAQENAQAAEELAFEQYQRGLESYTTVLEAQERSFDAQSSLIELKKQLIDNKVNLHVALGGDYTQASQELKSNNDEN